MSWITQCPHCHTRFRIHQAQLDARHGLVCCGRCQHAFNARAQLHPAPTEHPATQAENNALPPAPTLPDPEPSPDLAGSTAPTPEKSVTQPLFGEPAPSFQIPLTAPVGESHRLGWGLGIVVLSLALLLQLGHSSRTQLAATIPGLEPALVGYCRLVGCTMELPRHADLLQLEVSSLEASGESGMELSATIRNRATFAQALPDLQLELTDQSDTVIARKALHPADYLPAKDSAQEGLAAGTTLEVRLPITIEGPPPTGYKLLLFFPPASAKG